MGHFLTLQPGNARQVDSVLLEVVERRAFNSGGNSFKAHLNHVVTDTDGFKQFGTTVARNSTDTHLRHDLIQAFIDTFTVIQYCLHSGYVELTFFAQLFDGFISQERINRSSAQTNQYGEVVRVTGRSGFYHDVGVTT